MLFSMKKILIILGTRPEAIKLAPLILELRKHPDLYDVTVCNTEQQKELSSQALGYFGIQADLMLDTMRPSQSLIGLQARMMDALAGVFYAELWLVFITMFLLFMLRRVCDRMI